MDKKLIPIFSPQSLEAESYRILATNLKFFNPDFPVKTIVVTSAAPSEGKSLTAANLALTLTGTGNKVILIDADLRNPSLHRLFNIKREPGLTDVILGNAEFTEALKSIDAEDIKILSSGRKPPNPAELIGSQKMKNLLSMVKEHADFILIDTPPAHLITDAALIASFADGTLLVIESGKTAIDQAIITRDTLNNVRAHILGVIINKAITHKSQKYYYYYNPKKKKTKNRELRI